MLPAGDIISIMLLQPRKFRLISKDLNQDVLKQKTLEEISFAQYETTSNADKHKNNYKSGFSFKTNCAN